MNIKELFINEEKRSILFILVSAIALALSFLNISNGNINLSLLSWIPILLCGIPIFIEATTGLITEFDIKADVLVTIAIISSIIIGEFFAAGVVALIMAIGGFLEEYTVSKTKSGIGKLVDLSPTQGTMIINYNTPNEEEKIVDADAIKIDNILKVVPGEVIPVDGVIIKGESSIDQSVMTGESIPVDKVVGDKVFSGTINLYGSFIMKATKKGEDSSLQKLIKLVESANPDNAKVVKSADKWATWIVIVAFICAIITWFMTGEIIRAVTILVVFCPCAFILATPTAIMAALGNLTKVGILVKEGLSVEKLAKIDRIIFDKTGTLTYGKPKVLEVIPYSDNYSKFDVIQLLSSLESPSEHPLAKAIISYYKENYKENLIKVTDFEMIIGKGVKAKLDDNECNQLYAGNLEFIKSINVEISNKFLEENVIEFLNKGATTIYLVKNNELIGVTLLSDVLRDDAIEMITQLRRLGIKSVLLTGDNENAAKYICNQLDIVDYKYNCLPEDKILNIKEYQSNGELVAMIGDGINDAPSLKQADIGISMGGVGSDISIEASDVCLVSDDIKYIPHLIAISRKTIKTIKISLSFSLGLNILAMVLAILGWLDPIGGAFVHNIGSVLVIIYSSSLLRFKYQIN